ncbi:MAG: hypothetical protein GXP30_13645, partial [Verrucomicrobia bacterium]|nr:hypothetical protein [Verrucomicrobiota bacterium]
ALIVGVFLVMGACNKHSLEDTEFDKGVKTLYQPHGEGEHGDDHGSEGAHGDAKGHDSDKGAHHKAKDGDKHDKGHDAKKEHKEDLKQPAKSQFPKK